jgi:hypothetical protein
MSQEWEAFEGDDIADECGLAVGFVTTGAIGVAGNASATTAYFNNPSQCTGKFAG